MTKFDYIVVGLLLMSALVGFARGATREIAAVVALFGAAAAAVFGLKFAAPFTLRFIHTPWLAGFATLLGLFVAVYIALRLTGALLARRIQSTDVLGALDRTIGLLIGLLRGLIVLGALFLMFNAATPADLRPQWITGARTWPLAARMGGYVQALTPHGLNLAERLRPAFERGTNKSGPGDRNATEGYDARRHGATDDLVEGRSR